jgi:hypothetical protein
VSLQPRPPETGEDRGRRAVDRCARDRRAGVMPAAQVSGGPPTPRGRDCPASRAAGVQGGHAASERASRLAERHTAPRWLPPWWKRREGGVASADAGRRPHGQEQGCAVLPPTQGHARDTRRRVGSDRQWRAGVNRSRPVGGRAQAAKGPGNARGDADVRPAGWTGAGGGGGPPCCTRPARRWSQGTPVAGSRAHARCGSAKTAATEPPRVGLTGTSAGARPGCAAPVRRPGERDGTARRRRRGSRHPASRGS